MHHMSEKKYAALVKEGKTAQELTALMTEAGITGEEIAEFLAAQYNDGAPSGDQGTQPAPPPIATTPADNASLTSGEPPVQPLVPSTPPPPINAPASKTKSNSHSFDFRKLQGDEFKRYQEHVETLGIDQLYDFSVYKVEPVIKELYPGLKGSPKYLDGVTIKSDTPIHTTRINGRTVREMNAQVLNTGRFYILK